MSTPAPLLPYARTAWWTETVQEDGPPDASKYAGTPWIPEGESRPVCANCRRPMQLFLQLNTADLPDAFRGSHGEGLLQLFYCTSQDPLCEIDCAAWGAFSESVVARLVLPEGAPASDVRDVADPFPPRRIVGWAPISDAPSVVEAEAVLGVVLTEAEEEQAYDSLLPRDGDKLGGWPLWIQGVEYPECPTCGERMRLVFQLDSERHLPYSFGDSGIGHLTQCAEHTDELAFVWACG